MSDIDTVGVDGLKVLDPKRPIREADILHRNERLSLFSGTLAEEAKCSHDYPKAIFARLS